MRLLAILFAAACGPIHHTADAGDECSCRQLGAWSCSPEDRPVQCVERFPCGPDAGCDLSLCFGPGCCEWRAP